MDELLRTGLAELDGQQGVGNDGEVPDAWQYSIEETRDGKKYVRADRQVIFGNDPQSWSEQLEGYINGKIRRGEDVTLIGADGDELLLTSTSAGKLSDNHTSDGRTMSDEAFERKANAAAHIDELAQVSTRGDRNVPDHEGRHGEMASGGWNYRTAYFEDFDGKYYKLTISTAIGSDGKTIYNIGTMKEEAHPKIMGSRASKGDGPRGFASSDSSVRNSGENVNRKFSVSEDSQGRKLSEAQQAYFRDSAVRDEDGRLMVMYHGTRAENGDFTVFDYSKAVKKGGRGLKALGKGNYFTSKQINGTERIGSRVIEAYLNITNPFVYDGSAGDTVSLAEQVQKKTGTDTQGMSYDALQDAMRDLGYDGVVEYRRDGSLGIAVTFDSDQIKNVTNQNPTGDPDIRYSVSEGKTQDELLDFVTQFQRATEERFREVPRESARESVEDNAEAIRGDLEQLAELARQSEEAQGIQRQTPEELAESKVNARVGEEKPGFMDRLRAEQKRKAPAAKCVGGFAPSDDLTERNGVVAGGETVSVVAVVQGFLLVEKELGVEGDPRDLGDLVKRQTQLDLPAVADVVPERLIRAHTLAPAKHGRHGFSTPDR